MPGGLITEISGARRTGGTEDQLPAGKARQEDIEVFETGTMCAERRRRERHFSRRR